MAGQLVQHMIKKTNASFVGASFSAEDGLQSVPALLRRNATTLANAPAYREKELGIWQTWSWSQVQEEVQALALGLLQLGVKKGDFIAIIGHNRPCMYWSNFSAILMSFGGKVLRMRAA